MVVKPIPHSEFIPLTKKWGPKPQNHRYTTTLPVFRIPPNGMEQLGLGRKKLLHTAFLFSSASMSLLSREFTKNWELSPKPNLRSSAATVVL